jgi:hypothetical protein
MPAKNNSKPNNSKTKVVSPKYAYLVDVKQVESVDVDTDEVAQGIYVASTLKEADEDARLFANDNPGVPVFVYKVIKVYLAETNITASPITIGR